jgi:hypothetical protein
VSLHTVKKHVTHILDKLGAANRTEATARARELGLLSYLRPPPRYHPWYPFGPAGSVTPRELSSHDVHFGAMAVAAPAFTVAAQQP